MKYSLGLGLPLCVVKVLTLSFRDVLTGSTCVEEFFHVTIANSLSCFVSSVLSSLV